MEILLELEESEAEVIDVCLPIPVPRRLKAEFRQLQNVWGKKVNKKARELLEDFVAKNKHRINEAKD